MLIPRKKSISNSLQLFQTSSSLSSAWAILCGTANSHRLRELTVAFLLCVMRFTFIVFLIKSSSIQVVVHVATGFNRLGRFSITRWWKRCSFGLTLHIFSFQPAPAPPTQHTRRHSGHQSRSLALVDVPLRTSQH